MRGAAEPSIKELLGQLGADSKRLLSDEVSLARMEVEENARQLSRGLAGLAAALGIAVIAATGATVLGVAVVGDLAGRLWIGALSVGFVEVLVGGIVYKRGRLSLSETKVAR